MTEYLYCILSDTQHVQHGVAGNLRRLGVSYAWQASPTGIVYRIPTNQVGRLPQWAGKPVLPITRSVGLHLYPVYGAPYDFPGRWIKVSNPSHEDTHPREAPIDVRLRSVRSPIDQHSPDQVQ